MRQAWIEINLSALERNVKRIQEIIGDDCEIVGVVKADAYGHGSVECSKRMVAAGVKKFAVATIAEALELREAGIKEHIIVLGISPNMCADIIAEHELTPLVCSIESAEALSEAAVKAGKDIDCLFGIDTGMGRLGFAVDSEEAVAEAEKVFAWISGKKGIKIRGVMSHFSSADQDADYYTENQLRLFDGFCNRLEADGHEIEWMSIANSAGLFKFKDALKDAVRPGTALYGVYPCPEIEENHPGLLEQVMSIKANIVYIKTVPAGKAISYGRRFVTDRESVIATIPVGYADGYLRSLTGKAEVLVHGKRAPIVGTICMDQCMIDVTDIPDVKRCDEVILLGAAGDERITVEELAERAGTIHCEVMCSFGKRLSKLYVQ